MPRSGLVALLLLGCRCCAVQAGGSDNNNRLRANSDASNALAAAAEENDQENQGHGRRLQSGATFSIPGSVTPAYYASYINTIATTSQITYGNSIVNVIRGEQATYNVAVAAAGVYSVTYSVTSSGWFPSQQALQLFLVKGTNCFDDPLGAYSGTLSFGFPGSVSSVTSGNYFSLDVVDQQITLCFTKMASGMALASFAINALPLGTPAAVIPTVTYPTKDSSGCFNAAAIWESTHGEIRLNGKKVHLKGVNWYGFDTYTFNLNGLTNVPATSVLDTLQLKKVNLLRLPISLFLCLNPTTLINPKSCKTDKKGNILNCVPSMLAFDQLSMVFDEAAARGMLILLDMHTLEPNNNWANALWYDGTYSEAQFIQGWINIIAAFKSKPNFFGVDLFNEPHGGTSWGVNSPSTDFGQFAARAMQQLDAANPDWRGLYFVAGSNSRRNTNSPYTDSVPSSQWWGANFEGIYNFGVETMFTGANAADLTKRLVYTPHVYGPSVYNQSYFYDSSFPANMPNIWDIQVGYIKRASGGRAAVIGEWGGAYIGFDKILQDALMPYLKAKCLDDAMWWAVNPNAAHTGGLFESNWKNVNNEKFLIMSGLQPKPTTFSLIAPAKWCVNYGSYGNPACTGGVSTI